VALAQPTLAPAEEPDSCTVTTTVRCTGAAAPYAVQAAQPTAAPVAAPPVLAPPPPLILDAQVVRDGWKLTQDPDGRLWRERKRSTPSNAMWGGGLTLFLATYLAGGIGGMASDGLGEIAWWPVIGPMFAAVFTDSSTARALFAVDGLAQGTGFVLFLVGLAAGPEKLERMPVSIGPVSLAGGGSGVALSGRF
ncbi:MAG TPA: hypothetical protein VGL86_22495, partial [Polyangia bacterium]